MSAEPTANASPHAWLRTIALGLLATVVAAAVAIGLITANISGIVVETSTTAALVNAVWAAASLALLRTPVKWLGVLSAAILGCTGLISAMAALSATGVTIWPVIQLAISAILIAGGTLYLRGVMAARQARTK